MKKYKELYPETIFSINYDNLVSKPENEIKKLILWLGFEWDDKYLSPHLNKRAVDTTSKIQVRNPINNKSVALWKKYNELLNPVLEYFEEVNFKY